MLTGFVAERSTTHLVLIPSYNPGVKVYETVRDARRYWSPVWVVVDGSDDGTSEGLRDMARADEELRVIVLERNQRQGQRGAARHHDGGGGRLHARAHHGFRWAASGRPHPRIHGALHRRAAGDGAGPAGVRFERAVDPRQGRKISNWWANLETVNSGIGDSLYRLPRLSDRRPHRRDAPPAVDAALRFRPGSRGAPRVARPRTRQHPGAGQVPARPPRAACRTSTTCATTSCSPGCTRGWCSSPSCGCPSCSGASCAAAEPKPSRR